MLVVYILARAFSCTSWGMPFSTSAWTMSREGNYAVDALCSLPSETRLTRILSAAVYQQALNSGTYKKDIYMLINEQEYFAVGKRGQVAPRYEPISVVPPLVSPPPEPHNSRHSGTEAWFESTIRTDINGGMNTREKLKEADPGLSDLMTRAFGDGAWR